MPVHEEVNRVTEMGPYGISDEESERQSKEGMRAIVESIDDLWEPGPPGDQGVCASPRGRGSHIPGH